MKGKDLMLLAGAALVLGVGYVVYTHMQQPPAAATYGNYISAERLIVS